MPNLIISDQGQSEALNIQARAGEKLAPAIWLGGQIKPVPLCGGLGLCGLCRCRFQDHLPAPTVEDRKVFTEKKLADGWRLACKHTVPECETVRLQLPRLEIYRDNSAAASKILRRGLLAMDLGTTSIQWAALAQNGERLEEGNLWNPQAPAGSDVISRVEMAMKPEGEKLLSHLIRQAIGRIISQLAEKGIGIELACIAANSAMTEILLEKDISGLAHAPYHLSFGGNATLELDIPDSAPLQAFFPPLPAPFVGGDISAGILALVENGATPPFLLADLGTNAELALLSADHRLFLASAPLGPAMEGIGPRCGQPVGPGVITAFQISPAGLVPQFQQAAPACQGISATGYISLLAILLNFGIMQADGQLNPAPIMPIARKIASGIKNGLLPLPCGQFITPFDIEILLKVKAALDVAISQILAAAHIRPEALTAFYLAGALGQYANSGDLATLGFVPKNLAVKTVLSGNTSLKGAEILLLIPAKGQNLASLCRNAAIMDLANDSQFLQKFTDAMRWGEHA